MIICNYRVSLLFQKNNPVTDPHVSIPKDPINAAFDQIRHKGNYSRKEFLHLFHLFRSGQYSLTSRRILNIANQKILNFSKPKEGIEDFFLGQGTYKIGEIGINGEGELYAITKSDEIEAANEVNIYETIEKAAKKDPTIFDYIVRYKGHEKYTNKEKITKIAIATEYAPMGDLESCKDLIRSLPEKEKNDLCFQLIKGLKILHDLKIAHRDLKTENIFVFKDQKGKYRLKIGDFNLSCFFDALKSTRKEMRGTPLYMCIEYINEELTDELDKQDIWALGLIFYDILIAEPPFFKETSTFSAFKNSLNSLKLSEWFKLSDQKNIFIQATRMMLNPATYRPSIFKIHEQLSKKLFH